MLNKHEVKLNMDITAFIIANTEEEAAKNLSDEIEALILSGRHEKPKKLSDDVEIDSVDLQFYDATRL